MKPFLTTEEFLQTEFKVELFQNGVGKDLQKELTKLSQASKNWVCMICFES